ncbi:GtrA family protein [Cohnella zeiphila]|uniref:GtrA family protein n=1 Tax=Cohnella zeiphila TaxID=2761120 RepID=A0A7X0VY96_9BACL|nr:GtrA family protein [Cohnella zeiphila]MBB6734470.1 GtrA family protein [Cohnella zeiphila]
MAVGTRSAGFKKISVQFAHFSLIGLMNGAIDLLLLNVLLAVWHTTNPLALIVINSVAYAGAVLNSYYWNAKFTFRRESQFSAKEKTAFAVQALVSLLISNIVFISFVYLLNFSALPVWMIENGSKGISMMLSSLCSYFFMRLFVFKGSKLKKR